MLTPVTQTSISLYQPGSDALNRFGDTDGLRFSRFKHCEKSALHHFSKRLADRILASREAEFADRRGAPVLISPAIKSVLTAGAALAWEVRRQLSFRLSYEVEIQQLRRRATVDEDFSLIDRKTERAQCINNAFSYDGCSLHDRSLIFIDDALISGTHFRESVRALRDHGGADPGRIVGAFLVSLDHASTFHDGYSIESHWNRLWPSQTDINEILSTWLKQQASLSPRCLRLLMNRSWSELRKHFESVLPADSGDFLRQIRANILADDFHRSPTYQQICEQFLHWMDTTQKSRNGRSCGLEDTKTRGRNGITGHEFLSLYEYDGASSRTCCQPGAFHHRFGRQFTIRETYSCLKYGDPVAVEFFAEKLAARICTILRNETDIDPNADTGQSPENPGDHIPHLTEGWAVAAPAYAFGLGCAMLLGERVATLLGLPLTRLLRREGTPGLYGNVANGELRHQQVRAGEYQVEHCGRHKLILIEDAIVTGANLSQLTKLCYNECDASDVLAICVVRVRSDDPSCEETLNASLLSDHNFDAVIHLLRNDEMPIVVRTAKVFLQLSAEQRTAALCQLTPEKLVELTNCFRFDLENCQQTQAAIDDVIQELHRRLAVDRKVVEFTPLFCLTEDCRGTSASRLKTLYSRFKYGDVHATEFFAEQMARLIQSQTDADELQSSVIAGTFYYRHPNAARHLASRVSELLCLPLLDIRRRNVFSGEFGALEDRTLREQVVRQNCFIAGGPSPEGRHVIYIDDAVVSGAHLSEHVMTLEEAGAFTVRPFVLLDLPTASLPTERIVNCDAVSTDQQLMEMLQQPETALLTRSVKMLLRLPPGNMERTLNLLSSERVFQLYDAMVAEGYAGFPEFQAAAAVLTEETAQRHTATQSPIDDLVKQQFRLGLLDVDGTLGPVLSPVPQEMLSELYWQLSEGMTIAIISAQPIAERGLTDYFLTPFRDFVVRRKYDPGPLSQLLLLPSDGAYLFAVTNEMTLANDGQPITNLGFSESQWRQLQRLVIGAANGLTTKVFLRGAYISLHFRSAVERRRAEDAIRRSVAGFVPKVELVHKAVPDAEKWVLHVRIAGLTKATGKSLALEHFRMRNRRSGGSSLNRSEILVAGDRMGTVAEELADNFMIVPGGTNIALGTTRHPMARTEYTNSGPLGLLSFFRANRASRECRG